jgi:hypothetical protein
MNSLHTGDFHSHSTNHSAPVRATLPARCFSGAGALDDHFFERSRFIHGLAYVLRPALAAEDIHVQKLIPKLSLRIIFLTQLNKVWQLFINRFQLRRLRGKQFSPVRARVEPS